jgi:hypothetical protein
MYTIEDLWAQAGEDTLAAKIITEDAESYILHGIKFEKRDGEYKLLKGYANDFYPEVPSFYYSTLMQNGYRDGLCMLAMDRCEDQLEKIEIRIRDEANKNTPNEKMLNLYKVNRTNTMNKYSDFRKQLNQSINL